MHCCHKRSTKDIVEKSPRRAFPGRYDKEFVLLHYYVLLCCGALTGVHVAVLLVCTVVLECYSAHQYLENSIVAVAWLTCRTLV